MSVPPAFYNAKTGDTFDVLPSPKVRQYVEDYRQNQPDIGVCPRHRYRIKPESMTAVKTVVPMDWEIVCIYSCPDCSNYHSWTVWAMMPLFDSGEERDKTKTYRYSKVMVLSDIPDKTGRLVKGKIGKGYILPESPDVIYVVGDGWYGEWPLLETDVRNRLTEDEEPKF